MLKYELNAEICKHKLINNICPNIYPEKNPSEKIYFDSTWNF